MLNYFEYVDKIFDELKKIDFFEFLNLNENYINQKLRNYVDEIILIPITSSIIGHLALNTEEFLRYYSQNKHNYEMKKKVVIFVNDQTENGICNMQLYNMIKRKFPLIDNPLILNIIKLLIKNDPKLWNINSERLFYSNLSNFEEYNKVLPQLSFTLEEEKEGKRLLQQMGIDESSYICFHNRDKAYLENRYKNCNLDYHDYRDSDINSYTMAVNYIVSNECFAVRMGQNVEKTLDVKKDKIIDYSSKFRSDFGDIYLPAKCKFFLGSTSGLNSIPYIFNVPCVLVNMIPIGHAPVSPKDLYIPKKYWYVYEKRFLNFREIFEAKVFKWGLNGYNYKKLGIEIIDNTEEEILDVVKEMNSRIEGTWVTTDEDNELQNKFCKIFEKGIPAYESAARIGADFLKQNKELL